MQPWINMIGFAKKSGNIVLGEQMCIKHMQTSKISLLLLATDMNVSTKKKMIKLAQEHKIRVVEKMDKVTLSRAIGKAGYGVIGITSKRVSRAIREKLVMEGNNVEDQNIRTGEGTECQSCATSGNSR